MNINWQFSGFNIYKTYGNLNDVVYSYRYSVTVSDGVTSASSNGFIRLNFDNISNFVPFGSLTKEAVQQWTEASIDTQKIIKNLTEMVIAKGAETKQDLPAPWSVANGTGTT